MELSGILKGLKLDVWYKAFVYIGGVVLVLSLFLEAKGINNQQLQLLASGTFLIGMGEWKNRKTVTRLKDANAYTGPAALITYTLRMPDAVGILLEIFGVALLALGAWSIVRPLLGSDPTPLLSPVSPVHTPAP